MPNNENNFTISEKDLKQWHKFFAKAEFPLIFSDKDHMSLGVSENTWRGRPFNPQQYFMTPEAYSRFSLVAVDPADYTKGYRIRTGDQYVFRIDTYHGPMSSNCLCLSRNVEEASVYRPVFTFELTFYLQHAGTGQVLTRPWDRYTSGVYGRKAVLLTGLNDRRWDGLQQVFEMPMWPIRFFQMAKISTGLKFYLQHEGRNLYAAGRMLLFGNISDGTAVTSVAATRPSSLHSAYVLKVGGKFVRMTGVEVQVELVDNLSQGTPLCPVKNEDGGYCFWHSESDHVLVLKDSRPVFVLWKDTKNVPLSWQIKGIEQQVMLSVPNGQISLNDAPHLKKIIRKLEEKDYGSRGTVWDYSFNNVLEADWLIATPENGFANYSEIPKRVTATDNDFGLAACSVASSDPVSPCVQLDSSVNAPGGTKKWLRAGHSKSIYEEMYKLIISGREIIDITSLLRKDATPSGEFLAAVRNAITYLSKLDAARNITIRLLFGEPLGYVGDKWTKQGPYKTAYALREDLTRDIPSDTSSKMKLYIAYTFTGLPRVSWNHSKIIAVDGQRALVGGHNMWDGAYLGTNPVLDVSMLVSGRAAIDAHRFAENLWAEKVQSLDDVYEEDAASYQAPMTRTNGTHAVPGVSYFQDWFNSRSAAEQQKDEREREGGTGLAVFSVGRSEGTGENEAPSDKAIIALLDSAEESIYISGQAISHKLALLIPRAWPEEFLEALVRALERDIAVTIFLSDPHGGGSYAGDLPVDVMVEIRKYFKGRTPAHIEQKMERLKVCSFPPSSRWGLADSDPGISNHAKVILVDKKIFSIGSQNYYPSRPAKMAEFTYMVEDQRSASHLFSAYFEKMEHWVLPSPPAPPVPGDPKYHIRVVGVRCLQPSSGGSMGISSSDQIYVKNGDRKIWPRSRYEDIRTGQKIDFDVITITAPLRRENAAMVISIWEWDLFSDDHLWDFSFHIDATVPIYGQNPTPLIDLEPGRTYERDGDRKDDWSRYSLLFQLHVEQ
jgi:phosphatidylserine/phosphatidylglycerophosphate/cardiolipin synthase-like enzyme